MKTSNNHFVFFKSNLKYDGRIFAFINTLSMAFPNDIINLYNYDKNVVDISLPENVKLIYFKSLFEFLYKFKIFRGLRFLEYNLKSFFYLLIKRPVTIQVHHEVTTLGSILYKIINKNVNIVYDDKELYYYKENNIPYLFYLLERRIIKISNLVVITNLNRKKVLFHLNKQSIKDYIIIDNFEFINRFTTKLDVEIENKINVIKKSRQNILLHQGTINSIRGIDLLLKLVGILPNNWKLCCIGVSSDEYINFKKQLSITDSDKIENIGFVDYNQLNNFYKLIDAAVLFYKPVSMNNNFCAPNRLYSAVNNGKPIIVNGDNVTLNDFLSEYKIGESFSEEFDFFNKFSYYSENAIKLTNSFQHNEVLPELYKFYSS